MAAVVYKYPLSDLSMTKEIVSLPIGMKPRHVSMQNGVVTLWAEHDENAVREQRIIRILGTGFEVPGGLTYLGTVMEGPYVWHVYIGGVATDAEIVTARLARSM